MNKNEKSKLYKKLFIGSIIILVVFAICSFATMMNNKNPIPFLVIVLIFLITSTLFFILWIFNIVTIQEKIDREYKEREDEYKIEQETRKIKLLSSDGTMKLCSEHACMDNSDNTDEEAYVAICKEDTKYYHLCLYCYKDQPYKDTFDYWVSTPLLEARAKGLTLCPICEYEMLSGEEKVKRLLKNKEYKIVRLIGSGSESCQDALSWEQPTDKCFIEYDLDKDKYYVFNEYKGKPFERIGALPSKVVEQLSDYNIEDLECFIYSNELNDQIKNVCEIAIILGDIDACSHSKG